jgi:hypothetical protein
MGRTRERDGEIGEKREQKIQNHIFNNGRIF